MHRKPRQRVNPLNMSKRLFNCIYIKPVGRFYIKSVEPLAKKIELPDITDLKALANVSSVCYNSTQRSTRKVIQILLYLYDDGWMAV